MTIFNGKQSSGGSPESKHTSHGGSPRGNSDRIAIFIASLNGGGAERAMLTLANAFAERGFVVDLVLCKGGGAYLKEVSPRVRIVDLKCRRVIFSLPHFISYLKRVRPRVLLSAADYVNVVALLARFFSRVKTRCVISEHSVLSHMRPDFKPQWIDHLISYLMAILYPKADAIIAVSQGVVDSLIAAIAIPKEKVHVVYNAIVSDVLVTLSAGPSPHDWLAPDQPPVIMAAGRLEKEKDFPMLLRAFARARALRPLRLIILGEGSLRPELEQLVRTLNIASDVMLPGFMDNPFVWMRHAKIFVVSSRFEGLSMVLIEAMASGTSVISTDCAGGPREILEEGKWGRLVPVGDSDTMARVIIETLNHPLPVDVRERAAYFSVERATDQYLKIMGCEVSPP